MKLTTVNNPNWQLTPHAGYQLNSVGLSDDGAYLITGTGIEYGEESDFAVYAYSTDGSSTTRVLLDSIGVDSKQGVFWVAISGNAQFGAAGGTYGTQGQGFLRAYTVKVGPIATIMKVTTPARVNEVEMSYNGYAFAAVYGDTVALYTFNGAIYQLAGTQELTGYYVRSVAISKDGQWIVAGGQVDSGGTLAAAAPGRKQEAASDGGGIVVLLQNDGGVLRTVATFYPGSGVLRVVCTPDGQFFAASTKDGHVNLYSRSYSISSGTPVWSFTPSGITVSLTYALAIAYSASGDVFVGAGSNDPQSPSPQSGYAYMVQSVPGGSTGFQPVQLWTYPLQFAPNPGMNMDANATLLTATDGEPSGGSSETPGNFYLFDVTSGRLWWQYPTSIMNWPMTVNALGSAALGGSDDGSLYYWGAPVTS